MMKNIDLRIGDCLEVLKEIEDNSIDSIVTDPPYGLNFMGKKWDYQVPSTEVWKECLRVLKPGGHLLSFAGSRTYHRIAINIEDAGFEIRDQIMWLYGSGFPKSLNIGKAVDRLEGNQRVVVGDNPNHRTLQETNTMCGEPHSGHGTITKGTSQYEGWGTALKPAHEPICMARKPLSEKTVAENVLRWGTGGINIDESKIFTDENLNVGAYSEGEKIKDRFFSGLNNHSGKEFIPPQGRFPANIILECLCDEVIKGEKGKPFNYKGKEYNNKETSMFNGDKPEAPSNYNDKGDKHTNPQCPCRLLDEQSGVTTQGHWSKGKVKGFGKFGGGKSIYQGVGPKDKEKGGASRFFYCAKASKKDRNEGLEIFVDQDRINYGGFHSDKGLIENNRNPENRQPNKNNHPTVKPTDLMLYLIRLVTPKGGITLDPFMGSGSSGKAAVRGDFQFVGIEREAEYFEIAEARIEHEQKKPNQIKIFQ